MKWHLIVVAICVSLVVSDIEQVFLSLLTIGISSLKNCQVLCSLLN